MIAHTIKALIFSVMGLKETTYRRCLYYTSNVLSRKLTKIAEEVFGPLGLAPTYAYLLMTVNNQPGIQPSEISSELELTPSTVTRLVEKMEYQGYLERISKGRATKVNPTDKSLKINQQLKDAWQQLQDQLSEQLGDRYTEVLTEMTYTAVDKLE